MNIIIHRGQNQIGGPIIEISTESTRIIFDAGSNLEEPKDVTPPEIDGLFFGKPKYDAVIVSHYHSDHIGLLGSVLPEIPIYMGKQAYNILAAACSYKKKSIDFSHLEYKSETDINIGDMTITPYRCDHSAFDSYMFVISDGKKKVLYSGDFRANGWADFDKLLEKLPKVDALIIEGTLLSRETYENNITEQQLEDIAVNALQKYTGPAFVMGSAMNVDRMKTAYNIAQRTGRIFLEDLYTAGVLSAIGKGVPGPGTKGVRVFMVGGKDSHDELEKYSDCKIGRQAIAKSDFLMCIRATMKNTLKKINEERSFENGILFYSMWKGYRENEYTKEFLEYMESTGVKIHTLHTSGHADIATIDRLVEKTSPDILVPVHTERPEWFEKYNKTMLIKENSIAL